MITQLPPRLLSARVRADFREAERRRRDRGAATADLDLRQLAAVARVWDDAVADVPYYSALVRDGRAPRTIRAMADLKAVPILLRKEIQDQPEAFIRRSHAPDQFISTAGSTGTPLRLGSSEAERRLLRVVKLASWQEFGYRSDSRLFLIWAHPHVLGPGWRGFYQRVRRATTDRFLGYRRVSAYRLDRRRCESIAEELIRFKPQGLIGYSAALDLFARYTAHHRQRFRELSLGFVLSTTEAPPRADTVANLADLFGCPVVQEYGGVDFGQVALKVGDQPFEVYSDLNYVECEPAEDESHIHPLLVTSLYPRYVPLIRYRVGDGVVEPAVLPNGHVTHFGAVAGRLTDVVNLGAGDAIHSLSILHCVHDEAAVYNIQMRLQDGSTEMRLVVAPGADRGALESRIRARLVRLHPLLARVHFTYLEDIETNRAGKRRWCIDQRTHIPPPCAE